MAIGENASAWRTNSIVLGKNSESGADKNIQGFDPITGKASEDTSATWNSTDEAVSFGRAEERDEQGNVTKTAITRQLNNVAAGTLDTDAVNVAQLKLATTKINMHYYSVHSIETGDGSNFANDGATGTNAMAAGVRASATGDHSVAVGNGATAIGTDAIALGTNAKAEGQGALVVGEHNSATGQNAVAFGGGYGKDEKGNTASAVASVAFGENTKAKAEGAVAFGYGTQAGSDRTDNKGKNYGQDAVAFGNGTKALGGRSLAFGERTVADYNNSVAFGNESKALSTGSTAFGSRTRALAQYSTAFGNRTASAGNYATAFGTDTLAGVKTDASGAMWLTNGTRIDSNGNEAYTDGSGNTYAVENFQNVKNGQPFGETHNYVVVKGTDGKAYIQDYHGDIHAVTLTKQADGTIKATASTDISKDVTLVTADPTSTNGYDFVDYDNATAFGESTKAINVNATAFGKNSVASGENSLAFGEGSTASGNNSAAGLGGTASTANSIALGKDTKANNKDNAVSVAIGENAEASGARSLAIGFGVKGKVGTKDDTTLTQTTASGESAVSIGTDTEAAGQHSIAMGSHTEATKDSSLAIGYDTHATEASAVAIGSGTKVNRGFGVAVGLSALAGIDESDPSSSGATTLDGSQTVAFGYYARATAANAAALGAATSANVDGGVALGYKSATTRAAGNKVNGVEQAAYLKPISADSTNSTWTSTAGAVSVGNVGAKQSITRQITDVAAGSLDTDAVNVAQLKAAGVTVTSKDNSVGVEKTTDPKDSHTNYDLKVATATLTTSNGTVTNTNPKAADGKTDITNAYATGDSVANAINNSGFTLTTSASNGTVSGTSKELINPGETVTLDAGKNIAITQAQNKITVALADDVNAQTVTVTGKDGKDGQIGLTGRDGKDGTVTTIIKTIGKNGTDGKDGKPGVDGTNITRVVYQDGKNGEAGTTTHTFATLDDGLKFKGDAGDVVTRKLNTQLDVTGGQTDKDKLTTLKDKNIGVVSDDKDGKLEILLNKDLTGLNSTTYTTKDGDKTYTTINGGGLTIKEGDTDQNPISITKNNITMGGQQVHNVVAGTEDNDAVNVSQLKAVSGSHTAVTVNDKSNPTIATAGDKTYGDYAGGETDNLHIAAMKGTDGKMTYNIKLNDQLNIGKKGADGTDGKVTVDTKGGTTVIIGHDGENGKDGKDGLFVRGDDGKDGKSGISITGPNGLDGKDGIDGTIGIAGKDGKDAVSLSGKDGVGHIGLTGPKGADGKDGTSIDLSTDYRTKTLNPDKNTTVNGEEKASRIVYKDAKGDHEVATMDDGLKFIGDDDTATPIAKKLNETLQIRGDGTYDATTKKVADDGNIKTSVADGAVKVSLSDKINLHQNGSLTLGGDANGTEKDGTDPITIRHFDDKTLDVITGVDKEGKPITSKEGKAGDYITGLDNKTWNNESYVSGRAATEDQLHQAVSNLIGPNANGGFGLSANGSEVKQALGKTITINGDGMYGTDGKETTAGNISTSVKDGAIKVSLNKNLNIDSTTMEGKDKDGNKVSNVTNAEGSTITKADTSGKQSSTTINAGSLTIKDGDGTTTIGGGSATIGGVTINGNGEKDGSDQHTSTITGLSNKTFDTNNTKQYENSGRAATEAQLKEVYDKASQHTTVTVNGNPTTDGNLKLDTTTNKDGSKNYAISLNNDITLGDKDNNGKLTVQSKDGTKSITTNGEDGTLTFKDGSSTASMKAAESVNAVDGTTGIKRVAVDGHTVATMDDGMKFAGDSGEALKQKLNSTTNIKGGATGDLSDGNIGVVSDGKDTLNVKLAKDIKGLNSVEATTINATTVNSSTFNAGNTTMDNSGVTIKTGDTGRSITIKDGGVSMGGNQIHNVAPGTAPDDAVNVSQLNATNGVVNKLGSRINKVGAGAAALAALHPLDFDPDDKWDVAAGYGHYKNADAAAIGAFYQPNEDTMFSIGGSFGGGENMVNAGVSVKLGQGNHVSTSRVAMAKEIRDLRENVAKLNDVVNRQSALIDKLTGVNAGTIQDRGNDLFPDVPANHWAYEYVTALHKAGILEGYPDGTFSGDRMMTRYEFAAIVYRAIMAGAASNPALNRDGTLDKLAKEFSSEMKYIRIDTISKDRNGNPDIQRVRVIPQKQEKK